MMIKTKHKHFDFDKLIFQDRWNVDQLVECVFTDYLDYGEQTNGQGEREYLKTLPDEYHKAYAEIIELIDNLAFRSSSSLPYSQHRTLGRYTPKEKIIPILEGSIFPYLKSKGLEPSNKIEEIVSTFKRGDFYQGRGEQGETLSDMKTENEKLQNKVLELEKAAKETGKHHAEMRERILGAALTVLSDNFVEIEKYFKGKDQKTINAAKLAETINDMRSSFGFEDEHPTIDTITRTLRNS